MMQSAQLYFALFSSEASFQQRQGFAAELFDGGIQNFFLLLGLVFLRPFFLSKRRGKIPFQYWQRWIAMICDQPKRGLVRFTPNLLWLGCVSRDLVGREPFHCGTESVRVDDAQFLSQLKARVAVLNQFECAGGHFQELRRRSSKRQNPRGGMEDFRIAFFVERFQQSF